MNTDFENLVAYYIFAMAEERIGNKERANEFWLAIRGCEDAVQSIAETTSTGLFEK